MPRLASSHVLSAVTALALVAALAPRAAAQEQRIVVAPSGIVAHNGQLPITDAQVTDLIARNFPEILHGSQAYHVTLVVDANGNYVSGRTARATVLNRAMLDSSGGTFVMRDTIAGSIAAVSAAVRRVADVEHSDVPTTGGRVIIARSSAPGEPGPSFGMFGTDYRLEDISAMGMKRYDAGVLGDAFIMVSVVQLKN